MTTPPRTALPRSALAAALCTVTGVIVVLLSASPAWLRVTLRAGAAVKLSGHDVAAAVVALALVAAAGVIALALVRSWLRRLLSLLVLAAGAGVAVLAIRVLADPDGTARSSRRLTAAGEFASAHLTAIPALCALGGALMLFGALLALGYGGRWPAPAPRYERADARARRPADAWEALERGEDPTQG